MVAISPLLSRPRLPPPPATRSPVGYISLPPHAAFTGSTTTDDFPLTIPQINTPSPQEAAHHTSRHPAATNLEIAPCERPRAYDAERSAVLPERSYADRTDERNHHRTSHTLLSARPALYFDVLTRLLVLGRPFSFLGHLISMGSSRCARLGRMPAGPTRLRRLIVVDGRYKLPLLPAPSPDGWSQRC